MNNKEDQNWFEVWFDSPYYHKLYAKRNDKEASEFLDNFLNEISFEKDAHLLDLACGKGRHSRYLNSKGFEVTGIDLSSANHLYNKTFESENLHFIQWDMRKPLKQNQFDAVFNLFTSFGYFENITDNQSVINAIHIDLKQEGILVIDYLNVNYVREHIRESEVISSMGIDFFVRRKVENQRIIKMIDFEDTGEAWHFEERVQAFEFKDFEKLFSGKFEILKIYGDYNLNQFEPHASPRLILSAKKI